MNNKGNLLMVSIIFVVVLVLFGLVNMVTYSMYNWVDDSILEDLNHTESQTVINDVTTRYPSVFDSVILIVFAGLWIGGLASAVTKDEHPLIFGFFMLMIIAVLIAGMFLANSFEKIMQDTDFSGEVASFPKTYFLLTHLLEAGVAMMLSVLLVVMAKNRLS